MQKRIIAIGTALMLGIFVSHAAAAEVVIVVSAESQLNTLSRTQLTDIYLGRTTRLPDGAPVTPVDQAERSPAHDTFYTAYLGQTAAQIKAHWSRLIFTGRGQPPRTVRNGESMAEFVASNPNAIGYLDVRFVDERLRVVKIE